MSSLRKRLSVPIAWAMLPVALWAGAPSAACLCANGQVKFFCKNALPANDWHGPPRQPWVNSGEDKNFQWEVAGKHDCCGGGFCGHSDQSAGSGGVSAKCCCKPILTAPSVAPEIVKLPCSQAPLFFQREQSSDPFARPPFSAGVAEFDTGPPLDRAIVFRSLLI